MRFDPRILAAGMICAAAFAGAQEAPLKNAGGVYTSALPEISRWSSAPDGASASIQKTRTNEVSSMVSAALATTGPVPLVSAQATMVTAAVGTPGGGSPMIVGAFMSYQFLVVGPTTAPGARIPIDIRAFGTIDAGGTDPTSGVGQVALNIWTAPADGSKGNRSEFRFCTTSSAWRECERPLESPFTVDTSMDGSVGDVFTVSLLASSKAITYLSTSETSSFAETAISISGIEIDPVFLSNHAGYSLRFADGIGVTPVPEPASSALAVFGLAAVAARVVRSRRSAP